MQWPEPAAAGSPGTPPDRGVAAPVHVAADLAAAADHRFEAVCDELGILPSRRVEPVAARVLPFGTEQVAMVEVRVVSDTERLVDLAGARGGQGGAVSGVPTGGSVLAAALPGAVAEGRVRSAVVFADGAAPVRWGAADDETRLAALYAVVPHLGSFTATAGPDTYRVLRLPGVGVALVSEGEAAATWVEGWFAALLHATRYALLARETPTGLVATAAASPPDDAARQAAVLEQLERECRRILAAAQEEARAIREAATADAEAGRATTARAEPTTADAAPPSDAARARPAPQPPAAPATGSPTDVPDAAAAAREEVDAILAGAERARAALLADARREAEVLRREAEAACAALIDAAKADAERRRRAARREVKRARRKLRKLRREAVSARSGARMVDVVAGARRAADDLLADARRAADELVRDATRTRERAADELARSQQAGVAWTHPHAGSTPATPAVTSAAPPAHDPATAMTTLEDAQRTAIALLTAATESVAAMSALLTSVVEAGRTPPPGDAPPGSRLYFGD